MSAAREGEDAAPAVSVIVPHYSDLVRLDICLRALEAQTYPRDRVEIIVADNGSPEGEAAVSAAIAGRARLVTVVEKGAGPARNGGAAAATGEVLAFTDSDCVPEPLWLAEGVAALARADVVGGRMRVLVEDERALTGAEAFERVFAFDNETYVRRKGFSVTANLFCRSRDFRTVGGFRNGLSEDLEWCRRACGQGLRLDYAAAAVVGHPARRTWPELKRKWSRLNRETYALTVGAPGARLRWGLRSLLLPLSAVAHAPRVLASPQLKGVASRMSALTTLFRLRLWRMGDSLRLLGATVSDDF